jgi:uncharacterized protein YndB with AHSA1/START domain
MRGIVAGALVSLTVAGPAAAEVKKAAPNGFEIESKVVVPVSPEQAFEALGQVQRWWHSSHTYSGSSANLRMGLKAGDCFCEGVPADKGSVEHGRVVYSRPGSTLRVLGALGPLQGEAVTGTLTWSLKKAGSGTEVTQNYIVGGYFRQGAEPLAPLVDQVMQSQLARLKDYLTPKR